MAQTLYLHHDPDDGGSVTAAAARKSTAGRIWQRLLASLRAPNAGVRPANLYVPSRVWKRNSALLMSFYERNGN